LSFRDFLREKYATWVKDMEDSWYVFDGLDALLYVLLIWAMVLYVVGLWQSDSVVAGLGGVSFVVALIGVVVKDIVEDFQDWQKGDLR